MIRTTATPRDRCGRRLRGILRRFRRSEEGTSTIEFIFLFPAIFLMFGMTIEAGMYSMQQVMLERGLDMTVREVRLGILAKPTHDALVKSTCRHAVILPDCARQLRLEMIKQSPTAFRTLSRNVPCIDTVKNPEDLTVEAGDNNDLMILRVCVRIAPLMPFSGFGLALTDNGKTSTYALAATSSFVLEPFLWKP